MFHFSVADRVKNYMACKSVSLQNFEILHGDFQRFNMQKRILELFKGGCEIEYYGEHFKKSNTLV